MKWAHCFTLQTEIGKVLLFDKIEIPRLSCSKVCALIAKVK